MNNNPAPTPLTQPSTLTQPATLLKMDPLNQQALKIMLTEGTNKHMTTHETPGQTLTYLELREWYG